MQWVIMDRRYVGWCLWLPVYFDNWFRMEFVISKIELKIYVHIVNSELNFKTALNMAALCSICGISLLPFVYSIQFVYWISRCDLWPQLNPTQLTALSCFKCHLTWFRMVSWLSKISVRKICVSLERIPICMIQTRRYHSAPLASDSVSVQFYADVIGARSHFVIQPSDSEQCCMH